MLAIPINNLSKMEEESFTVMLNLENEELSLSTADLSTIIQVPALEPFILSEDNVLGNINSLDVGEIHADLLENFDHMELHLECDDDRNYDMSSINNKETSFLPTALVGNNVNLRISFSSNHCLKQETDLKSKFTCTICAENFRTETKFCRHMLSAHQIANPFHCKSCNYAASSRRLLIKHMNRRHIKKEKVEKSNESRALDELSNDSATCDNQTFNTRNKKINNKTLAEKSDTPDTSKVKSVAETVETVFKCEQCDYTCKQKRSLNLHSKKHANEFDFQCNECKKSFVSSVSLKRHGKTHLQTRPFVCMYKNCDKSFKVCGALTDHEKYVHGKSQIVQNKEDNTKKNCNIADKNCKIDRKFKCTYEGCEKSFRDSYNLRAHIAVHSGMKSLKCSHCDFVCVQKNSLNWHVKSKHNI